MKQFNIDGPVTATTDGDFLYKSDVHLVLLRKKNTLERDLEYIQTYGADEEYKKNKTHEVREQIRLIDDIVESLGLK